MKSFTVPVSIVILCFVCLCLGQNPTSELKPLALDVDSARTFEFYDNETYVGYSTYTVTKRELYNETEAYFIESEVDMTDGSATLHVDAFYVVDMFGRCLHYEFEATINGEPQSMNADFSQESVHITASRSQKTFDKTVELLGNTLSVDNNMIGQWDIMFSVVPLQENGSFAVSIFAAQPMEKSIIRAEIAEGIISVQAAGKTWQCLKVEFSTPEGYTAYVTVDGQLIQMEHESGVRVTLTA
jgi:hypothetical protein